MSNITLDSVLTVAIGRNGQDGQPMNTGQWLAFQARVRLCLEHHGATVVAHTVGGGVGSDGVNDGADEESTVFVAINPVDLLGLRHDLAQTLRAFDQHSACFAFDLAHEPVFATSDGFRPSIPDSTGAWLAEGHTRRTQR